MTGPTFRRGVRLALDWGDARIGVAACDPDGLLAYAVTTVQAGDRADAEITTLVGEYEPLELVVGHPRSLSGREGPAAVRVREHAERLAGLVSVPVRLVDERLTTVAAARRLRESGRSAREQRRLIDAASAVGILEHAIAVERARGDAPGELVSAAGSADTRDEGDPPA